MLSATFKKYTLKFKRPSKTSRDVLTVKDSWFIVLKDSNKPNIIGIGECGLLKGLSVDDVPEYESKLREVCQRINEYSYWLTEGLTAFPSIHFGLETALKDLAVKGSKRFFPSDFIDNNQPININGLIWMGNKEFMFNQIKAKLREGFNCLKIKIGAIDFEEELALLKYIRSEFSSSDIELRVDANGAFLPKNALEKLKRLAEMDLHSIEQPIKQNQPEAMAKLCEQTPLPIALDEELIGVFDFEEKKKLLATIRPQYIILKPSLLGGYKGSQAWIDLCETMNIPWWITSALESNIGLNAIAQWTATLNNPIPQGLGTGQLYLNNFDSPLQTEKGCLWYKQNLNWDLKKLFSS